MDILTLATNGLLLGFGAWASFLIVMGIAALIMYFVGGRILAAVEKQK